MESYEHASTSWSLRSDIFAACIGGLLYISLLVLWKRFDSGKRLRLPPGPAGWPVLGHLPMLGTLPHQSLMKLSQKYGPLMSVRLGLDRAVVISSPEMAKIFLRTQDHVFASRPPSMTAEVFMYNYQDMGFSPFDEKWRLLRRLVESEIFSMKRLKHLKDVRREEMLALIQRLLGTGREGKPVELNSNIIQLSFDHMCRICFNKRNADCKIASPELQHELKDFPELFREWSVVSVSIIGEHIPFLRKLDLGGHEARLLELRIAVEKYLDPIIEEHRRKVGEEERDFLDVLLSLQREKVLDGFPDEQIKALLQDMLIGGADTTANTTIWALAEIMRHPEVRQKIVDELDLVVEKDRLVDESDLVNLKYLKATVKETFRMYPVVPLNVPHASMADTQVAGYDIPRNTTVLVNIYGMGRDPKLWTNPNIFNPERFVDNPMDVKGRNFELLPFSAGRRRCPGMDMGLFLVEMGLAQILHTCVLSLPPGVEVDVEEGPGLTLSKVHPLHVLVSPRLRPEVYSQYGISE